MPPEPNGLDLLRSDHQRVAELGLAYAASTELVEKVVLAEQLCLLLTVHAQVEEEIFYPALREAGLPVTMLDKAVVEHMTAKQLVMDVESASIEDLLLDAKVQVLVETTLRHVEEEEQALFAIAAERLDLHALGQRLAQRRSELSRQAALALKARLRGPTGPAAQMASEEPSASTHAMPGPMRAAAAAADLALTVLPGGGRLRRVLDPAGRDDRGARPG